MKVNSYKDLIVWQKSVELVIEIYKVSLKFPDEERYGLTSQMRRCAISIPSNIAEGRYRGTKKDFRHFITIAFGSGAELETQIILAKKLPLGNKIDFTRVDSLILEIMKMLNKMISRL